MSGFWHSNSDDLQNSIAIAIDSLAKQSVSERSLSTMIRVLEATITQLNSKKEQYPRQASYFKAQEAACQYVFTALVDRTEVDKEEVKAFIDTMQANDRTTTDHKLQSGSTQKLVRLVDECIFPAGQQHNEEKNYSR